jgi:hypothetical protein
MKIALLISGRATRYEVCLLPILENSKHEIDLFMSINGEECEYYEEMKETLKPWLKGLYIHPYVIPEGVEFNFEPIPNAQYINGKWLPFNVMSCFFNDHNAMNMAVNYETENNIKYDCFMKFRPDIYIQSIPEELSIPTPGLKIYSIFPLCHFISNGIYKVPIVSGSWDWGNKESMLIYCNTYNYILQKLKETNGTYYVASECSLTDNIYENNVPYEYVRYTYGVDINRRVFDKNFSYDSQGNKLDSRDNYSNINSEYVDIKTVKNTKDIPLNVVY